MHRAHYTINVVTTIQHRKKKRRLGSVRICFAWRLQASGASKTRFLCRQYLLCQTRVRRTTQLKPLVTPGIVLYLFEFSSPDTNQAFYSSMWKSQIWYCCWDTVNWLLLNWSWFIWYTSSLWKRCIDYIWIIKLGVALTSFRMITHITGSFAWYQMHWIHCICYKCGYYKCNSKEKMADWRVKEIYSAANPDL